MHEELTRSIIGPAMKVHRALGVGFLESVYHRALLRERREADLRVESEKRLKVFYDAVVVGDFDADLFVEDVLLIELKAVQALNAAHTLPNW